MKTYITFGQDHRHVINDVTYDKDCVAVVECKDSIEGRELAHFFFEDKFCFTYYEGSFDHGSLRHFPRGLITLVAPDED